MAGFKRKKTELRQWLESPAWSRETPLPPGLAAEEDSSGLVSALIACLPLGGESGERAAFALGGVMRLMEEREPEEARNVVRRLMWHMNEESGNIGWGVPEAMGWILARSAPLAERYHRILISYILPLESDSNYCDHAPLRISCFRAVEILLEARPEYIEAARGALLAGLRDEDPPCRAKAQEICRRFGISA